MIRQPLALSKNGWRFQISPSELARFFKKAFRQDISRMMYVDEVFLRGKGVDQRDVHESGWWKAYFSELFHRYPAEEVRNIAKAYEIQFLLEREPTMSPAEPRHNALFARDVASAFQSSAAQQSALQGGLLGGLGSQVTRQAQAQREYNRQMARDIERMTIANHDAFISSEKEKLKAEVDKLKAEEKSKQPEKKKPKFNSLADELQAETDEWLADMKHLTKIKEPEKVENREKASTPGKDCFTIRDSIFDSRMMIMNPNSVGMITTST